MATPNMNLTLPTVSTTLGPAWATLLNDALEVVDAHDHTSGKGLPILTAALNINADLPMNGYRTINHLAVQLVSGGSPLSGLSNINSLNASAGNLYWTNSAGVAVQLTSGSATVPAVVQSLSYFATASNWNIQASDTRVVFATAATIPSTIELPPAATVGAGRLYVVKDRLGNAGTNNITVLANTSTPTDNIDGASSRVLSTNYSSLTVISDGVDRWSVI